MRPRCVSVNSSFSAPDRRGPTRSASAPSDDHLIDAAAQGDRRALDDLLRAHQERIYTICIRMMGNEADARDATQEAMLAICRGISRFDRRSALSTWVYRVTTNACLDELRRRSRRPVPQDLPADIAEPGTHAPTDAVVARLTINVALARLPEDFRAALVLRDIGELDYAEIASVLEIAPGTVRSRIARARAMLTQDLRNQQSFDDRPNPQP